MAKAEVVGSLTDSRPIVWRDIEGSEVEDAVQRGQEGWRGQGTPIKVTVI